LYLLFSILQMRLNFWPFLKRFPFQNLDNHQFEETASVGIQGGRAGAVGVGVNDTYLGGDGGAVAIPE